MTPPFYRHILNLIGIFLLGFCSNAVLPVFLLNELSSSLSIYPKIMLLTFAIQIVLEIPSGYVADYIGRWPALMIGTILNLIGCIFQIDPSSSYFILSLLLFCGSSALYTGTISSYAYEICEKNNTKHHYIKIESYLQASYFVSWLIIIIYAYQYPLAFSEQKFFWLLAPSILSLPLLFLLPYQSQKDPLNTQANLINHLDQCLQHIWQNHFLLFIIIITTYTASITSCLISLITTSLPHQDLPTTVISTCSFIIGAICSPLVFKTTKNQKLAQITKQLVYINHLTLLFIIISSTTHLYNPILIFMLLMLLSYYYALLIAPTMEILNQYSTATSRATTISICFSYKRSLYCFLLLLASSMLINALIFSLIILASSLIFLRWFQRHSDQIPLDYPS
jgi:MFS family permease